jgi:hypothetical protein
MGLALKREVAVAAFFLWNKTGSAFKKIGLLSEIWVRHHTNSKPYEEP